MSKTPELKRQDMTAVRLAHPVEGCQPLAIPEKGAMLQKGDRVFQSGGKGGSGGGIFRVVNGQLVLEAIVQGAGTPDMDGKPYDEELYQNQSGLVGLGNNVLDPLPAVFPQPSPSP